MSTTKITQDEARAKKTAYMHVYRQKNADRINAQERLIYADNPERERAKKRADYHKHQPKRNEASMAYGAAHREQIREYQRLKYQKDREARIEAVRKYQQEHKEKLSAAKALLRKTDPERFREYHRRDKERHGDEIKARNVERYAALDPAEREKRQSRTRLHYEQNKMDYIHRAKKRRLVLVGTYTQSDIAALYEGQRGICLGCRKDLNGKYEIDHVMPLSLDPAGDKLENLQLLCMPCNRGKHAMHPDAWMSFCYRTL